MESNLEASIIEVAGKWALHLTQQNNLDDLETSKILLEENYIWAKNFLQKHIGN